MSAKPFVFDTDVLIIGGGFSGSWAALTARQHVENVLIVDKGPRDWGGLGGMSGGDMIVKQPEFAAKDLVEELVYYYDGLCEQDVLEEILNQSYERFKDYEKMGHEFARDDSGRLMSIPQRGLELMRYYFYHPYGKMCIRDSHGADQKTDALMTEINEVFDARIDGPRVVDADIVHAFVRHFPQDDAGDARRLQRFHVLHIDHVQPDEDEPADALLVETPHGEALLLRRELRPVSYTHLILCSKGSVSLQKTCAVPR